MKSDVCLILEGTYPYVSGGVSTWIAQILEFMPHIRFSILFIGPKHNMPRIVKYKIPHNVIQIKEIFIHDYPNPSDILEGKGRISNEKLSIIWNFIRNCSQGKAENIEDILKILKEFNSSEELFAAIDRDENSWEELIHTYKFLDVKGLSFRDFFWTNRFISLPVLNFLKNNIPKAKVYHSACTGYAGLIASKAALENNAPFILTEHGIYNRERRIEIFSADWISGWKEEGFLDMKRVEHFFKNWWSNFFDSMSSIAYNYAKHITTLFEDNKSAQIQGGASEDKITIIPNGISLSKFVNIPQRKRTKNDIFNICFIGRVTEIKDIKTLLKSLSILNSNKVNFNAYILGPMDEEPEYAQNCIELSANLGIDKRTFFKGRVNILEYLPKMDVSILTSISEAQPFVILEANCAAVPFVSTDVGAVKEMLYGRIKKDIEIGKSGIVASVGDPQGIANALKKLYDDPEFARKLGQNGRKRVKKYYNIIDVMKEYQKLYELNFY